MDDVAAAAGVGKGTLFHAFGSRAGLVQALWQRTYEPLRDAIEGGPPPLGPGTDPRQRILAVLDAILVVEARQPPPDPRGRGTFRGHDLYEQPQYELVHQLLSDLLPRHWTRATTASCSRTCCSPPFEPTLSTTSLAVEGSPAAACTLTSPARSTSSWSPLVPRRHQIRGGPVVKNGLLVPPALSR